VHSDLPRDLQGELSKEINNFVSSATALAEHKYYHYLFCDGYSSQAPNEARGMETKLYSVVPFKPRTSCNYTVRPNQLCRSNLDPEFFSILKYFSNIRCPMIHKWTRLGKKYIHHGEVKSMRAANVPAQQEVPMPRETHLLTSHAEQ